MTGRYRIEYRWILMSPLLGYFSGLVSTAVLVGVPFMALMGPLAPIFGVIAGIVGGGPIGAGVGLVAGMPLALLVGPHLPLRTAVRRAGVLGAVVPPVVLLGSVYWLPAWWLGLDVLEQAHFAEWPYLAAAFMGALVATRTVRVDMPRTDVS